MKKVLSSFGAMLAWMVTGVASAQTTTATSTLAPTINTTVTPGVPNTGVGDMALNMTVLGISAVVALAGAAYLYARSGQQDEAV